MCLCLKEDLKEEEVQVHPRLTNRGCLASTRRHPLTFTLMHKNTGTLTPTRSRARRLDERLTRASRQPVHPGPAVKNKVFPLQLHSNSAIIECVLSSDFIEFCFTAVLLLFAFPSLYCCVLIYYMCFILCRALWQSWQDGCHHVS